jgi:hypothetical protein
VAFAIRFATDETCLRAWLQLSDEVLHRGVVMRRQVKVARGEILRSAHRGVVNALTLSFVCESLLL